MGYREPAALAPGRELARGRLPRALRLRPAGAGSVAQHGPALSAGTAWTAPGRSRDPGREPSRCHPPRHPRLSLNGPGMEVPLLRAGLGASFDRPTAPAAFLAPRSRPGLRTDT